MLNPIIKLAHSYKCMFGDEYVVEGQVQAVRNAVRREEAPSSSASFSRQY